MRHLIELWLAQEAAGHGHSHDTPELTLRDVGDSSDIGVAHRALQRDAGQDLEVAKPADAGDALILKIVVYISGQGTVTLSENIDMTESISTGYL